MKAKTTTKKAPATTEAEAPTETRDQKLARLAAKRMNAALTKIRLIGNLAAYKPTTVQVDKIAETLATAVQAIDARLRASAPSEEGFIL